jgi:hypothetical protein
MTLDEIAYNLLNAFRGGRSSQDENISLDQIKFNIKHYRAVFIRRDYARNGLVTRHLEQDLRCVELEKVDLSKCCGITIDCPAYRTVKKIPRTVRFNFEEAITYVGDITGINRYQLIKPYEVAFISSDKYTKNNIKAYMIEDYLYILNNKGADYVNIRGIFENPEDAFTFSDCSGAPCYTDASEFPMPMDMVQAITQGMISGELRLLAGTIPDITTDRMQDASPNIPNTQPPQHPQQI